ncbi:C-type mannose receptor 2-like [Betta splendens]|uniref:C-type mannose receptor 2-like n=1 Tax=Betta splendens TaxID=158456 RepID=A0A6P7KRK9_BETSP|nr:C-type mannose receptor 2-like [Betta splendens]
MKSGQTLTPVSGSPGPHVVLCSLFPLRTYYYVDMVTNWTSAQNYCRVNYDDLATTESMSDINMLKSAFPWSWIGLSDDPNSWKFNMGNDSNSWRWSATGDTSKTGYQNWIETEPNRKGGNESCVIMTPGGGWKDVLCSLMQSFVCYSALNQSHKTYTFVSNMSTWTSAQSYCREHYTDLPVIDNSFENTDVYETKPGSAQVWIGLYRVPWVWSDKSQSTFRHWQPTKPNNYGGNQHCVSVSGQGEMDDDTCATNYPFICQQVSKQKTTLRMKIQTNADISSLIINDRILQQLIVLLSSQGRTDFKIKWKIHPKRHEEATQTQCNLHL